MICLCCGKEQNRKVCWNCWGDYIQFSKKKVYDLDLIEKVIKNGYK